MRFFVHLAFHKNLTQTSTQKVASAWSRSNLPPPELDIMFRAIESIYKANRGLLAVCSRVLVYPHVSEQALAETEGDWDKSIFSESPWRSFDAMG
jgi:hypothetical protein